MRAPILTLFLIALLSGDLAHANSQAMPRSRPVAEFPAKFPYGAFEITDELGRELQFFLTDADAKDDRPLILVLQGSGCASNFLLREGRVAGGWFGFVRRAAGSRAQILLVDKPGVQLFDFPANPGDTSRCSEAFRREHTGERWLVALQAALRAAREIRGTTPRMTLVLGHSEGAVMAPRLAASVSGVTHAASLASAPVSQLQDFVEMANSASGLFAGLPGTSGQHLGNLLDTWASILDEPESTSKQVYGHTHRYWADKFAPVDYASIARPGLRMFLAYGDRDENAAPRKMDQFAVEMLIRKADLTWVRIPGADHGFAQKGEQSGAGLQAMLERAVAWFLDDAHDTLHQLWPRPKQAPTRH